MDYLHFIEGFKPSKVFVSKRLKSINSFCGGCGLSLFVSGEFHIIVLIEVTKVRGTQLFKPCLTKTPIKYKKFMLFNTQMALFLKRAQLSLPLKYMKNEKQTCKERLLVHYVVVIFRFLINSLFNCF